MKYIIYPDSYLMALSRKKLVALLRQAEEEIKSLKKANADMYHDCPCYDVEYTVCEADPSLRNTVPTKRPTWCPLKDIKEDSE